MIYPNLNKLKEIIIAGLNTEYSNVVKDTNYNFEIQIFSQTWGSTCLGFDISDDGEVNYGGQMMTEAATTVFHETNSDIYIICFDEGVAYMVWDPSEQFYKDLKDKQLKSISGASVY